MNLWTDYRRFAVHILIAILFVLPILSGGDEVQIVRGLQVPAGYDDKGNLTSQLFGGVARMHENGDVEIEDMRIEFYENGETNVVVTAADCLFNKNDSIASSKSEVRVERKDMVITGVGFRWSERESCIEILDKAMVILGEGKGIDLLGKKPEERLEKTPAKKAGEKQ